MGEERTEKIIIPVYYLNTLGLSYCKAFRFIAKRRYGIVPRTKILSTA